MGKHLSLSLLFAVLALSGLACACQVISSPGTTTLSADTTGAPYSVSGVSGITLACIIIASDDVTLDCSGHSITNDATSDAAGIVVNGSTTIDYTNVVIRNCPSISDYERGIYLYRTSQDTIRNSTARDNTAYGIQLYYSDYNTITNNTIYGNPTGVEIGHSNYNIFANSAVHTGNNYAFELRDYSTFNNFTGNIVHNISGEGIRGWFNSSNNTFSGNVVSNNSIGFQFWLDSSENTFLNNTVANNSEEGFYITYISGDGSRSDFNNFINNTVYNNSFRGFFFERSNRNTIAGNTVYNNSLGFRLYSSDYCNITNNSAYNNTSGFSIGQGSTYNTISGNTAHDNSDTGIYLTSLAQYSNLTDNIAYNNARGFHLSSNSDYNNFTNNTVYSNSEYGILLTNANGLIIANCTIYGNQYGLYADNSDYTVQTSYFLPESGAFTTYANLSLSDVMGIYEEYTINWSSFSGSMPTDRSSFAQKYINITAQVETPSIDEITFHWLASELSGYNESAFELWKFNSSTGWTLLNNTPDTTNNYLKLYALNPESIYGILQYDESAGPCEIITSPGTTTLTEDATGAPNPVSGIGHASQPINYACIIITSSNVIFDCDGHSITNNATADAAGIVVNGSAGIRHGNVTIRNCPSVSQYEDGALVNYTVNATIRNSSFQGAGYSGVYVINSGYFTVTNSTALDGTDGFVFTSNTENGTVADNEAYGNSGQGFYLSSKYSNFTNNSAYSNTQDGFRGYYGYNNTLANNTAYSNGNVGTGDGFGISGGSGNLLANNIAYNNTHNGFKVQQNSYNTLTNNTAYDNDIGIFIYSSTGNALANNTIYGNSEGIYMSLGTGDTDITNCTIYGNEYGIYVYQSDNYTMQTTRFLPSTGALANYLTLSVTDYMSGSESYSINWSSFSASMPTDRSSFAQKYINITKQAGATPTIDEITFHWLASELSGYNESVFELWKFNSSTGWTLLNNTPDTANNYLRLYALNPSSIYGILEFSGSDCGVLSSPGTYSLSNDISGAPNAVSGVSYISQACMIIASDDVTFDCNGSSITNDGTPDAAGIVVNGSASIEYTNVTIRNCPDISQYERGVYLYYSSRNTLTNNTAHDNTQYGFILSTGSTYNSLANNTAYGNTQHGFFVYSGSSGNNLTSNIAHSNTQYGIYLMSSDGNTISNCTLYDNQYGFYADGSDYTMQATSFLPATGAFSEYTNLSITDTLGSSEEYTINWSSFSASMPGGRFSFAQKYVNITTQAGTPGIDEITLHWLTSELSGYNESVFELWEFTSSTGWTLLNNTPDTTGNKLQLYSLSPSGIYGILESNDTTAPTITIVSPANTTYNVTSVALQYTTNADTCGYTIDGGTYTNLPGCANTTLTSLTDTQHYVTVYVNDSVNNSNSSTVYFIVDTTPPTITINSPANTTYNTSSIPLQYTTDADTCGYKVDGGTYTNLPGCANTTLTSLTDTQHYVTVYVNDSVSNSNSSTVYFIVDTTGPTITISSPANTTYNVTSVALQYTTNANTCGYTIDGGTYTNLPGCANTTLTTLSDAQHYVTVYVNDSINNTNSSTVYFIVDTTPPTITINSPANITYNTSSIPLQYTTNADTCGYKVDGGTYTNLPGCANTTLTSLTDTQHYVTVYVNDSVSNSNSSAVYFIVDTTGPAITISSPANTTYNVTSVPLTYTTNADTCGYKVDGGTYTNLPGCANTTLTSLTDAQHYVTVYVNDSADNSNSSTVYFIVDTTAPTISITSPANTTYNTTSVALQYTTNANTCGYTIDGGTYTNLPGCANTTLTSLSDTQHYVTVYVNDTINNSNSSTVYFIVDATPPTITISSPANTTYNVTSVALQYTTNANTCGYTIDGGTYTNLPGCANTTLTTLSDAQHYVTVYVNDSINNSNSSTVYFIVDAVGPTISISSPANTTYNTTSVALDYTVGGVGSGSCWYSLDGGAVNISISDCSNTTLYNLDDAQHYVTVYVNDSINNTNSSTVYFIVDTTPPTIIINSPANITYNTSSIPLQYTTNADTCGYKVDGGTYTNLPGCANTTLTSLSDTQHYVTIYVNDSADNSNSSTVYFTVDTTAPTITISSPANTTYNTTSVALQYTTNANTCGYTIDGGTYTNLPGCANTTLTSLTDTQHYVTVYVNDSINNSNSSTVYFTVDTTAPTISITSPANTTYNTTSVPLTYTTNADTCGYKVDGGTYTNLPGCANTTLTSLTDAQHYVTVYVNDSINNSNSSTVYFIVDAVGPTISISSPANTTYNTTSVALDYTVGGVGSGSCWYSLDGGAVNTSISDCSNATLYDLGESQHYVSVYVNDSINNTNSSTVYFIVDTSAPTISITSPANTTYNTTSVALQYTTNADTCGYTIDGGTYTNLPGCANTTLTSLTDTQHYVTVYVNDSADNSNSSTVYFIVDTTAPTITISSPANTTYNTTSVPLTYTTNADTCGYKVDGGTYTNLPGCANTTLTSLTDAQHYVTVYVNDSINNTNSSTVYFIVDTTAPTITISSPANTTYNTTSVPLTYTTNADTCGYTIDGGPYTNLPGCANITLTSLTDAQHYVTVYVNDSVNNSNSSTVYFTVDTTPPTITISSPANTTYNVTSVALQYTTNADTCGYTIDGGTYTNLPGCANTTLTSLTDTQHYVTVYVNDSINNSNSSTVYFIVDTTAPTITVNSPANTTYNTTSVALQYTTNADTCGYKVDGGTYTNLPGCANTTLTSLTDTQHYVTVYVNDSINNSNSSTVYFIVDATPPTISITSPTNTTYNTTSVALQYTTNADTCGYTIDGGTYTNLPGCANTTLTSLTDTQHYVTVYVNDTINNSNASTVYFTVDTTPPTISIVSPANTTYNISSIDLNYTTNADTCGYTIDGGAINTSIQDCSNTTLYDLDDAQHYLTVHVNDSINNTNASTVYFIVDADPPTITIESPENTTYASGADIPVNYTTNGINCTLFLDGSLNQSLPTCTNTTIGNLSDGSHNLTIYANDSMGRTSYAASLFVMGTGEEPGGGHNPQEPECESDSDCSECYYCSIAAGECILKSESECAYDGDCSALGGGYTCDSCACIAPECVTSDDCDEGEYCSDYHCTEIPECITNHDCENDEYCSDNNCLEIECDCGEVKDHGCRRYECCDDSDCGHGYGCRSHSCILLPEAEGTDVEDDFVEAPVVEEASPINGEELGEIVKETTPLVEQEEEPEARTSQEMWESVYSGIWVGLFFVLLIALLYAIFFGRKRKRREE